MFFSRFPPPTENMKIRWVLVKGMREKVLG
jgi:hypothetical protein